MAAAHLPHHVRPHHPEGAALEVPPHRGEVGEGGEGRLGKKKKVYTLSSLGLPEIEITCRVETDAPPTLRVEPEHWLSLSSRSNTSSHPPPPVSVGSLGWRLREATLLLMEE